MARIMPKIPPSAEPQKKMAKNRWQQIFLLKL